MDHQVYRLAHGATLVRKYVPVFRPGVLFPSMSVLLRLIFQFLNPVCSFRPYINGYVRGLEQHAPPYQ
jgi:hypothetical protein